METILLSITKSDLQDLIAETVNACLKRQDEKTPLAESDCLLTIQQVGVFLTLSVPTIYGLVSRSEIPVSKKGKRLYFSKQELTEWVKAGRKTTTAETATAAANYIHRKQK